MQQKERNRCNEGCNQTLPGLKIRPSIKTEWERLLNERMVDGRRCLAEVQTRGELSPPDSGPLVEARGRRGIEAVRAAERAKSVDIATDNG
jgi:hypothetical protein